MLPDHFIILSLAALIVGMSKGGLSSAGTLAVPMLTAWYDPLAAASLLLPVYLVSDAVGVWVYRKQFSMHVLLVMIPAGLLGVLVATLLAPHVPAWTIVIATGIIGLAYCFTAWRNRKAEAKPETPSLPFGIVMGVLTGITSFIAHSGAPPYQSYVLPLRLPKLVFAGSTTITFAVINLSKLPAYLELGLMQDTNITSASILCAVAVVGTFLGRWIAGRLPDTIYRRVITGLLFVISLQLIAQALLEALAGKSLV